MKTQSSLWALGASVLIVCGFGVSALAQVSPSDLGYVLAKPGDDLVQKLQLAEDGESVPPANATRKLYIAAGLYFIDETLVITKPLTIEGASREGVVIVPSASFAGDAMIEIVAVPGENLRGVRIQNLTVGTGSGLSLQAGIIVGRHGACLSSQHVLDSVAVNGRFYCATAILGAELSSIRDCAFRSTVNDGCGLYASNENLKGLASRRAGGVLLSGTTSFIRVEGGVIGTGDDVISEGHTAPALNGNCVELEGAVSQWTFVNVVFSHSSAASPETCTQACLLLSQTYGYQTAPYQIQLLNCGNDQPRVLYGVHMVSGLGSGGSAGVFGLTLNTCRFVTLREAIYAEVGAHAWDLFIANTDFLWGVESGDWAPGEMAGLRFLGGLSNSWISLQNSGSRDRGGMSYPPHEAQCLVYIAANPDPNTKIEGQPGDACWAGPHSAGSTATVAARPNLNANYPRGILEQRAALARATASFR